VVRLHFENSGPVDTLKHMRCALIIVRRFQTFSEAQAVGLVISALEFSDSTYLKSHQHL
jgi:hypothetical protein